VAQVRVVYPLITVMTFKGGRDLLSPKRFLTLAQQLIQDKK